MPYHLPLSSRLFPNGFCNTTSYHQVICLSAILLVFDQAQIIAVLSGISGVMLYDTYFMIMIAQQSQI